LITFAYLIKKGRKYFIIDFNNPFTTVDIVLVMSTSTSSAVTPVSPDYIIERIRVVIKDAHVFKLPPRASAKGWRGADWSEKVWQGTLKVMERGDKTLILLVDERQGGKVFATCPVKDGSVDRCIDSSRYFVLRVENASGRHMFIGVAFNERTDAFDFNTALEDSRREKEYERRPKLNFDGPKKDYSLKEGQKIHVKIPLKNRRRRKNGRQIPTAINSAGDSAGPTQTSSSTDSAEDTSNQLPKTVSSEDDNDKVENSAGLGPTSLSIEKPELENCDYEQPKLPQSYGGSEDDTKEQFTAEIVDDNEEKDSWKNWLFKKNRRLSKSRSVLMLPSSKDTPSRSNRFRRTLSNKTKIPLATYSGNSSTPDATPKKLNNASKSSSPLPFKMWGDWGSPAASTAAYS